MMEPATQERAHAAATPREKSPFHDRAFALWLRGLSHREIAKELGTKTSVVSGWSSRETWRLKLAEIGKRLTRKAVRRETERLAAIKDRHRSIARRGMARVESKLKAPVLHAGDLRDLARASADFGIQEQSNHPEFVEQPVNVRFPELVSVLESVWATKTKALPSATAGSGHRTNGRLELPPGIDPREAYCAQREAGEARRPDAGPVHANDCALAHGGGACTCGVN